MDKNEPELKSTQMLREAILDSELLLSHASEKGLEINPDFIKAIVNAKKNEQNNTWTKQDEIDFWVAIQTLSKVVQPVSIDSLRASAEPVDKPFTWWERITFQRSRSKVAKSVNLYRRFALFSMFLMLAIQIYSIIGIALMSKINSANDRMVIIEKRIQELILVTSVNAEDRTAEMERDNLEKEHFELMDEMQSSIELINDWLNTTFNIWSRTANDITKAVLKEEPPANIPDVPVENSAVSTPLNVVVVQQAKSLIIILNQYILPLLYGLLGGFAFVLRSLANETKKMIYTPTSNIEFGLRIHLGALAGLVIGFLWGDFQGKSFGIVESLSPLAVAFLAGYSVDFLFRLIDSAIGNVAKKEPLPAEAVVKSKEPLSKQ